VLVCTCGEEKFPQLTLKILVYSTERRVTLLRGAWNFTAPIHSFKLGAFTHEAVLLKW